jgi:hypothetical protein
LGVWQKPPSSLLPGFLEQLLAPPNESNELLAEYYSARAHELQEKVANHWRDGSIRDTAFAQQTIIQIFYTLDGSHSEENSVYARVGHGSWKDICIELPPGAGAAPLRIDFVSALTTIEIASIRLRSAASQPGFASIEVRGDAERLPADEGMRLKVTGIDPQLHLPTIETPADRPLVVEMRMRVT